MLLCTHCQQELPAGEFVRMAESYNDAGALVDRRLETIGADAIEEHRCPQLDLASGLAKIPTRSAQHQVTVR